MATSAPLCFNGTELVLCTPSPPSPANEESYKWEIALVAVCAMIIVTFVLLTCCKSRQKKAQEEAKKKARADAPLTTAPAPAATPAVKPLSGTERTLL
jgi:hypothetical protein